MKLILALTLALGLAACSNGGATPSLGPIDAPPSLTGLTPCERAMELAALVSSTVDSDTDLDQAVQECDSYADWSAASTKYPSALDGEDPREFAQNRCADGDGLASEPLCQEVGQALPCVPGFVCGGALVAGEYTSTSTGAIVTFTLAGEGWSGQEDTPGVVPGDGFALFNDAIGGPHGISVYAYSGEVFTDVCSPESIGTAAMDLTTFLAAVDGVQAEESVPTQVGGRPAIRLDLTTDSPCDNPEFGDRMWLWPLPVHGDFHFNDGERVRVYAVDAGCDTVAIVIEALPGADYDVLLQKSQEVIATMTITPAC